VLFRSADIFDYVIDDFQSPEGGFYSSRDADSEGLEGAFYIWTVEQIQELLGEADAKIFCAYFDVTPTGNWFERMGHAPKGPKNILHIAQPIDEFARAQGIEKSELTGKIAGWRKTLRDARDKRVPPGLDDKILTGWNGLMIASLAKGARVLDEPKYGDAAARGARFILEKLRRDGRLLRTYRNGKAKLTAYLSDYSFLIEGLLNLYEATFDPRWLNEAVALTDDQIKRFYDTDGGAFFFKLAYTRGWIVPTPPMRCLIGMIAGFVVIAIGEITLRRGLRFFAGGMFGLSVVWLYLTAWAASPNGLFQE